MIISWEQDMIQESPDSPVQPLPDKVRLLRPHDADTGQEIREVFWCDTETGAMERIDQKTRERISEIRKLKMVKA